MYKSAGTSKLPGMHCTSDWHCTPAKKTKTLQVIRDCVMTVDETSLAQVRGVVHEWILRHIAWHPLRCHVQLTSGTLGSGTLCKEAVTQVSPQQELESIISNHQVAPCENGIHPS
jgi:hypothetical protein